jgi:hypothetical protein
MVHITVKHVLRDNQWASQNWSLKTRTIWSFWYAMGDIKGGILRQGDA